MKQRISLLNRKNYTLFWMGLSLVLIALLVTVLYNRKSGLNSSVSAFMPATLAVASKFYCPCGSCTQLSLETCGCKNFKGGIAKLKEIESELIKGKQEIQVIKEFQIKYKSIKPEFSYLIQ